LAAYLMHALPFEVASPQKWEFREGKEHMLFDVTLSGPDGVTPADKPIVATLTLKNTDPSACLIARNMVHAGLIFNGAGTSLSGGAYLEESENEWVELPPGQVIETSLELPSPFYFLRDKTGEACVELDVRFTLYLCASDKRDEVEHITRSEVISARLSFSHLQNIPGPEGPSIFFKTADQVFVAESFRSPAIRPLNIKPEGCRALTDVILCNAKKMFWHDRPQRRPRRPSLRGFNNVFYGDEQQIWTNYGDAKVKVSASFETLGAAQPSLYSAPGEGYRCAYGRDSQHAYFFCESVDTKHAKIVRSCKKPAAFEALGGAWARDDRNVYLEEKVVKGADAKTIRILNGCYAVDKENLWYLDRRVEGVTGDLKDITLVAEEYGTLNVSHLDGTSEWTTDKLRVGSQLIESGGMD
jgi:hypothetical protein